MRAEWEVWLTVATLVVVSVAKFTLAAIIPAFSPAARWVARMTAVMGMAYALSAFWFFDPRHEFRPWLPTLLRLVIIGTTVQAVRSVVGERGGWRRVGRDLAIRARLRWRAIGKGLRAWFAD